MIDKSAHPGPDTTGRRAGLLSPEHRALTIGMLAVVFLVAFEAMAVATAMPVAVRDLGGLKLYAWAFSAFVTASLFGTVVGGQASDRRGPLLPFVVAVATFGTGLLVSGTATTMSQFVVGRGVQGFGAGLNAVLVYVVAGRAYPEIVRPRLFSLMSAAWVLPAMVGPSIAGVVADTFSWRWVFLGVPPLIVPALALMLPRIRTLGPPPAATIQSRLLPAAAAALGVALLQLAGQRLDAWSWPILGVAAVLLVPSIPRLLPSGTLRARRGLPATIVMRGILAGAFFGAETFVPLMLVEARGLATALAGLALTGGALGWSTGSWLQGRPRASVSRPQFIRRGAGMISLGIAVTSLALWPVLPALVAGLGWSVAGLGMGLSMSSVNVLMLSLSTESAQGFNSAALQVAEALGSIVFIGLGGAVFAALHTGNASDRTVFLPIFAAMAALALAGVALAARLHPDVAT